MVFGLLRFLENHLCTCAKKDHVQSNDNEKRRSNN